MPLALIVEDERVTLDALVELVESQGFTASGVGSLADAREAIRRSAPDVVLLDLSLPDGDGMDLLDQVDELPGTEVILITGHASIDSAVTALREGVCDYLTKPIDTDRLRSILSGIARAGELRAEIDELREQLRRMGRFGRIIGVSPAMQEVYELISKGAPTSATILLIGDSGTGKEIAAETIHQLSKRRKGPFLPLNCGAVSPSLIESQLFGHEKGSFTGAARTHRGFFERASGGTLFLDEITEMPIELQVKLLRVLETSRITRVGGDQPIEVDTRVLAATNRDPDEAVTEGKLRDDLLYRLKVFPIVLPPLSEREDDTVLLAEAFLREFNQEEGVSRNLSPGTLDVLRSYPWPGNVRELKNVIQRAAILAESEITPDCLPAEIRGESGSMSPATAPATGDNGESIVISVGSSIAEMEKRLILATVEEFDGNKKEAAKRLGISLRSLYNRLKTYREQG